MTMVLRTAPRATQAPLTGILFILIGVLGRSPALRGAFEILSTMSIPSFTWPNTGCFDGPGENQSRYGLSTTLMKNWQLPLFGRPVLAIDSVPRAFVILASGGCSSWSGPNGLSPV